MASHTSTQSTGAAASPRALKQQKVWDVTPSEFSMLCANPIRKIVDNIKKPENTDKALIPLSLGASGAHACARVCVNGFAQDTLINVY